MKKGELKEKKTKTVVKKTAKEKEIKKEPVSKKPFVEVEKIQPEVQEKKPEEKKEEKKKQLEKKTEAIKELVTEDQPAIEAVLKPDRYWEAVGRRKTSVARVRLYTKGDKNLVVNGRPYDIYFQSSEHRSVVEEAFKKMKSLERFRMTVVVRGGGIHSQAEAIRHGVARALTKFNPDFRKRLRRAGFMTRDPRMKERKKFGLKKARRAPQWAKR